MNKFITGEKYWSTNISMESEGYLVNPAFIKPWQGILSICGSDKNAALILSRFFADSGEIDDDSNARAFCGSIFRPSGIFHSYEEAKQSYINDIKEYIKRLNEEIEELTTELSNLE